MTKDEKQDIVASLKPCPCCGNRVDMYHYSGAISFSSKARYVVECNHSYCPLFGRPMIPNETIKEAACYWNRFAYKKFSVVSLLHLKKCRERGDYLTEKERQEIIKTGPGIGRYIDAKGLSDCLFCGSKIIVRKIFDTFTFRSSGRFNEDNNRHNEYEIKCIHSDCELFSIEEYGRLLPRCRNIKELIFYWNEFCSAPFSIEELIECREKNGAKKKINRNLVSRIEE